MAQQLKAGFTTKMAKPQCPPIFEVPPITLGFQDLIWVVIPSEYLLFSQAPPDFLELSASSLSSQVKVHLCLLHVIWLLILHCGQGVVWELPSPPLWHWPPLGTWQRTLSHHLNI